MERTIFYSWQSDLPKRSNLNFIEDGIKKSVKTLDSLSPIPIRLTLDKATRNTSGTPDITESIFQKISNCSVFVADISLINGTSTDVRRTPNPNVLFELGYASRALGWNKIICIFNTDSGMLSDMPFDLRNRRIMTYSAMTDSRSKSKNDLSNDIVAAVQEMQRKGVLTDKIFDFLKTEIDKEILGLLSHITKICRPINQNEKSFLGIQEFLNSSKNDIIDDLKDKRILGFYLLKKFDEYKVHIYRHINQAMSSQYYNREILNSLIEIYDWFAAYETFRDRYSDFAIALDEKQEDLYAVKGSKISRDNSLPDRYLLMKRINKNHGQVINFGDFNDSLEHNLTTYYKFNDQYLERYAGTIMLLIKSINDWLDCSNGEFIIDFVSQFRVKTADGEWL